MVQVRSGAVQVSSRPGKPWPDRLPELKALSTLGTDLVLDGELVVVATTGGGLPAAHRTDQQPQS